MGDSEDAVFRFDRFSLVKAAKEVQVVLRVFVKISPDSKSDINFIKASKNNWAGVDFNIVGAAANTSESFGLDGKEGGGKKKKD